MERNGKFSVERSLENIFFISRLVGTFPLDHNYNLSWGLVVFLVDIILNVALTIFEMKIFRDNSNVNFHSLGLLRWILLLPPTLANFASLYFKVKQIRHLFEELLAFEQYMHRIGVVWDYHYRWWNKYLSLVVIFFSVLITVPQKNLWYTIITLIKRAHVYITFYTIVDQVSGTTSILASAIAHLKYIRNDRQLLRKYERLIFLRRNIEEYFGFQMLAITAESFVSGIIISFWSTIIDLFNIIYIWILLLFPLVAIYVPLLKIISQATKIEKLLYRRLLANPNDELLEFHMTVKRKFTFTAFGFFHFDKSLVGSMIGAGTTYLVILMQYVKK